MGNIAELFYLARRFHRENGMRSPSPCGGHIGFRALLIWLQVLVLNGLVYAGGASLVVTTTQDEDDGTVDPAIGAGTSLREAVNHAQSGEHVVFDAALDGQTNAMMILLRVAGSVIRADGSASRM